MWFAYLLVYGALPLWISGNIYALLADAIAPKPAFWLVLALVPAACVLPGFLLRSIGRCASTSVLMPNFHLARGSHYCDAWLSTAPCPKTISFGNGNIGCHLRTLPSFLQHFVAKLACKPTCSSVTAFESLAFLSDVSTCTQAGIPAMPVPCPLPAASPCAPPAGAHAVLPYSCTFAPSGK